MLGESMKQKRDQQMEIVKERFAIRMKIDYSKAKQLAKDEPNITEQEYWKRFWELWGETKEEIER